MAGDVSAHQATPLAGRRVCLVTSGAVGSNPRLVKEADALAAAGAHVHVIAIYPTALPHVQLRDQAILARETWPCTRVREGGSLRRFIDRASTWLARRLFAMGFRPEAVVGIAYNRMIAPLRRAACAQPAELYIAHNLAALPAAHAAAEQHGARLGFDAEDFHSGELPDTPENVNAIALARRLETRYLCRCDYMTAASPGIGAAYASLLGLPEPTTVLNVFPLSQAPEGPTPAGDARPSPSLYWFSQTIGPGRGLEEVLAAMALSRSRPTLFLQGSIGAYGEALRALCNRLGVLDLLRILPPALPDDLPRLASHYDIGIAPELSDSPNRDICLTNKVFTYLLAGIPVVASKTTAQVQLSRHIDEQAFTTAAIDAPQAWASAIDTLLSTPGRLAQARNAAWTAGQTQFHWEHDAHIFLDIVARTLSSPPTKAGP